MKKMHPQAHCIPKTCLMGITLLVFSFNLNGQTIAGNQIIDENPNLFNPYTNGQIADINVEFSGISRSGGIIGYNATDRYNASAWNTDGLDENKYFSFIISPKPGASIEFASFEYTSQASATGPKNVALRSSADNFETDIGIAKITGTAINLSGDEFQGISSAIEFRVYAWGASTNEGTFSINSFAFKGHVFDINCPVPSVSKAIIGSSGVNCWQKGVAYSVPITNRAVTYIWSLPNGASISFGEGTNSVLVDFADKSGSISVRGINDCGLGPWSPLLNVNVEYPVVYKHNFGVEAIKEHPYEQEPEIIADKLSNSFWYNNNSLWASLAGVGGLPNIAISSENLLGSPFFALSLDVVPGFRLKITEFDFWRRSSATGPNSWVLLANNEIVMGNGTSSESYSYIGKKKVKNEVEGLIGNVVLVLFLNGATNSSGTFRLDDFTLYGMVDCLPVVADSPEDVVACGSYALPALSSGNYYTEPMGEGTALFENDIITSTQTIYVYAESPETSECFDEKSFTVTIHPRIGTNLISRVGK